jgi:peptide-methionine (R)-S-oxide reductase
MADQDPSGAAGFEFVLTDEAWRERLSPERYAILRRHKTERAGTSALNHEKRPGRFLCAGCGHPLFDTATKFESGSGWPSFWQPLDGAVGTRIDRTLWMTRVEVHCRRCGGHLGHVFEDGPKPTGLRFCMNGLALDFQAGEG